ncbi:bifunctional diguanylate cyclase/phosphodiesterase [Rhodobacterales bacterium]|nr:bifunctional diguanylate cyclase/phosphodiesterase [Rhodobacterales bacterium]
MFGNQSPFLKRSFHGDGMTTSPVRKVFDTLRLSTGTVIVIMIVAIIGAFSTVLYKIWAADRLAAEREVAAVARVFETHKQRILGEMERYAASNAAYLNVDTNPSPAWIANRFAQDMYRDSKYSAMFVLDPDYRPTFASTPDPLYKGLFDIRKFPNVERTSDEIRSSYVRETLRMPTDRGSFAGRLHELSGIELVDLGNTAALVGIFAIVPDPGNIPIAKRPPHLLVTVQTLNEAHLSGILRNLSLSDLIFTRDVPKGMNSIRIIDGPRGEAGYLAWHPMSQSYSILLSSAPVLALAIGVILIITVLTIRQNAIVRDHLAKREEQARYAANHDGMTGYAVREHFTALVHDILSRGSAGHAALIYLDLDRLKEINDTHGHAAGDKLIRVASGRIRATFRRADVYGRVGGDEFLVFVWGRTSPDEIIEDLQDLLLTMNDPVKFECKTLHGACSAGLALFPEHGRTLDELTRAADIALHRCKQSGGNMLRVYDEAMDRALKEAREMREELVYALQNDEFELHYQPIINVRTGRPDYAEALLRWHQPERGIVPPDIFIPIAESAGLMPEIGLMVLEQAVADASRWKGIGVSVNVASSQLMQEGFAERVRSVLEANNLSPRKLILEITETQILDDVKKTKSVLKQLHAIGVRCALDDFGTGYSSLSYLHQYDFSTLKIDKQFVQDSENNANSRQLLATVIDLGRILGMDVVVEGVETAAQLEFVTEIGCSTVQGYYFARPMPAAKFEAEWRCCIRSRAS